MKYKKFKQIPSENRKSVRHYRNEKGEVKKGGLNELGEMTNMADEKYPHETVQIQIKNDRISNVHDKILKFIAQNNIEAFLKVFGFDDVEFKKFLSVEITDYTLHQSYCDIVLLTTDDKIYIIEFQSTKPKKEDKIRFGDYQTSLHRRENGKEVIVIVITIIEDEEDYECYGYGNEYQYKINKRSTTYFDAEETIEELALHIKNDCFDKNDFVKLELLPYMETGNENRKRLLKKGISLNNLIKNLSKDKKAELNVVQTALAWTYFEQDKSMQLLGELNMNQEISTEGIALIQESIEERFRRLEEEKNKEIEEKLKEKDKENEKKLKEKLKEKDKEIEEKDKELKEKIKKIKELIKNPYDGKNEKTIAYINSILLNE